MLSIGKKIFILPFIWILWIIRVIQLILSAGVIVILYILGFFLTKQEASEVGKTVKKVVCIK